MEHAQNILNMIDKITAGDNLGAKDDFNMIISTKTAQALDDKKVELSKSVYSSPTTETEDGSEE